MKKHNYFVPLLFAIALCAGAADPPAVPALTMDAEALAARARAHLEASGARGVVLAIVHADGRVVRASAGQSAREERPSLDGATLFEIGSISKGFTGLLVADMVRRGELALDDPVDRHLPEALSWKPGAVRAITIRQLMTHTSGLPRLPEDWRFSLSLLTHSANPYADYTREQLFGYLSTLEIDPRGERPIDYSNLGVGLLGHVLAARAGKPWQELVRERITEPLGMASTFVAVPAADLPRFALGHSESGLRASYWDLPAFEAAGALRSSADDLAKLALAALNARPPFAAGFFATQAKLGGKPQDVGYNWFVKRGLAGDFWWHNGGTGGFRTLVAVMPERGVGVVALSNSAISVDALGTELLGQPPSRVAAANPVFDGIIAWVAVVMALRLAFFRFVPEAAKGWRKWLRTDHDTIAGFAAMALETVALTAMLAMWAPVGAGVGAMRVGYAALMAVLAIVAAIRFARGARRANALGWLAEPKRKNALRYGVSALVSIVLLAWLATRMA